MKRFNVDHQAAIIDAEIGVQPGGAHDFTDEQIKAGLTGSWSDTDPRAGLEEEKKFKSRRDSKAAAEAEQIEPAEPETKE